MNQTSYILYDEDNTDVNEVEIEFLRKKNLSCNLEKWSWEEPPKSKVDIKIIKSTFIIYGPTAQNCEKGVFYFPDKIVSELMKNKLKNL